MTDKTTAASLAQKLKAIDDQREAELDQMAGQIASDLIGKMIELLKVKHNIELSERELIIVCNILALVGGVAVGAGEPRR